MDLILNNQDRIERVFAQTGINAINIKTRTAASESVPPIGVSLAETKDLLAPNPIEVLEAAKRETITREFHPRINTIGDQLNFALSVGVCSAAFVGTSWFFGSLLVPVVSVGVALAVSYGAESDLQSAVPETPTTNLPAKARKLPNLLKGLSKKFQLPRSPVLHVFDEKRATQETTNSHGDKTDKPSHYPLRIIAMFSGKIDSNLVFFPNAIVCGRNPISVVVNKPFINDLGIESIRGIFAHELGHVAAHYVQKQRSINVINSATSFTGSLGIARIAFDTWHGTAAVAVAATASYAASRFLRKLQLSQQVNDIAVKACYNSVLLGTSYGLGRYDIMLAWAVVHTLTVPLKLARAYYGRASEYQADRLAAEVVTPKGYLQSMKDTNAARDKITREEATYNKLNKTLSGRLLLSALELFSDHPTSAKRCAKLQQMASRATRQLS